MVPSPQSSPGWNIVSPYSLRDTSNALKSASARASEKGLQYSRGGDRVHPSVKLAAAGTNVARSLLSTLSSDPLPLLARSLAYSSAAAKSGDPGKSDRYLKGSKVVGRRSDQGSACPARRGGVKWKEEGRKIAGALLFTACLMPVGLVLSVIQT